MIHLSQSLIYVHTYKMKTKGTYMDNNAMLALIAKVYNTANLYIPLLSSVHMTFAHF